MPQFYLDIKNISNNQFVLERKESHHVRDVFRKKVKDLIDLFDGKGGVYSGLITKIEKDAVYGEIREIKKIIADKKITIFIPLLKRDRFEWLLEKITELGVTYIRPIITSRTQILSKTDIVRWKKIILSAAKQSMVSFLPEIFEPVKFVDAVNLYSEGVNLLFHNYEKPDFTPPSPCPPRAGYPLPSRGEDSSRSRDVDIKLDFQSNNALSNVKTKKLIGLWVGPEGGFSDSEIEKALNKNFHICSLGNNILRTETAGIVALALVNYELTK